MTKANVDIRAAAKREKVFLWQIADALNINESMFIRKLRKELPEEMKERVFRVIEELSAANA